MKFSNLKLKVAGIDIANATEVSTGDPIFDAVNQSTQALPEQTQKDGTTKFKKASGVKHIKIFKLAAKLTAAQMADLQEIFRQRLVVRAIDDMNGSGGAMLCKVGTIVPNGRKFQWEEETNAPMLQVVTAAVNSQPGFQEGCYMRVKPRVVGQHLPVLVNGEIQEEYISVVENAIPQATKVIDVEEMVMDPLWRASLKAEELSSDVEFKTNRAAITSVLLKSINDPSAQLNNDALNAAMKLVGA